MRMRAVLRSGAGGMFVGNAMKPIPSNIQIKLDQPHKEEHTNGTRR